MVQGVAEGRGRGGQGRGELTASFSSTVMEQVE